jgi:purine-nucleoside phosphorylase
MENYMIKMHETEEYIRKRVKDIPKIAIILGSGLGSLADDITNNGSKEFMDILGEKYLAENSAALAKGGDA